MVQTVLEIDIEMFSIIVFIFQKYLFSGIVGLSFVDAFKLIKELIPHLDMCWYVLSVFRDFFFIVVDTSTVFLIPIEFKLIVSE